MFCGLVGCAETMGSTDSANTSNEGSLSITDTAEENLTDTQTDEEDTKSSVSAQITDEISVSDFDTEKPTPTDTQTDEKDAVLPPSDTHTHVYEKTVVAPTCTKKGYTLNQCVCGDSHKNAYKDRIDYVYGDWTVTIKPSYFGEGKESRFCTLCGREESVVLPVIPHYTCEERGIDVYEVQRLALEYIATLEDAIADPTLIGTDRGGTAGWTLRTFTYSYETQEALLARIKSDLLAQYETCIEFYTEVRLHVLLEEDSDDPGDYVFYVLYN